MWRANLCSIGWRVSLLQTLEYEWAVASAVYLGALSGYWVHWRQAKAAALVRCRGKPNKAGLSRAPTYSCMSKVFVRDGIVERGATSECGGS